jgi:hypothetical protein
VPNLLTFSVKGHLMRVGARFARDHVMAAITQRRRRSQWWYLESSLLATLGGGTLPQGPAPGRRGRPIR